MSLMRSSTLLFALFAVLAQNAVAQSGGPSSGHGGPPSNAPQAGGGSSAGGSSGGAEAEKAAMEQFLDQLFGHSHIVAHGVLASLAFVIFFPIGALTIRLPTKFAFYIHIAFQIVAYVLFLAAFGLGVWMARKINMPNFNLLHQAHPAIGILVFSFLSLQPVLGVLHHVFFKKHSKRTVWSHAHLWVGRLFITLGIINGGLGLKLADNAGPGREAAYGVVAGIVWVAWMATAVFGEFRRGSKRSSPAVQSDASPEESVKEVGGEKYYA